MVFPGSRARDWFDHFHLDQDPMEVFSSHVDKMKFFPEVPLVLKSLKSKYDLIIASGIPTNLVELMMRDFRTCFKRIFSPVTDLQQVSKTAEFYKHVCNAMGVKPSATIHVGDDVIHDFEIPRTVGIQSFLLDRTGEKTGEYVIRTPPLKNGKSPLASIRGHHISRMICCLG